jgi:RNA polymerase sigma factor (sigma-70 family)
MPVLDRPRLSSRKTPTKPKVEDHVGLVYHVVKKYISSLAKPEDTDEFSDGMIGLWKATEGYDPAVGKFSTYAYRSILNEIKKGREVRGRTTFRPLDNECFSSIAEEPANNEVLENLQRALRESSSCESMCIRVVRDHYIVGIPLTELSIKYGLNRTTVYRYLEKGLQYLRCRLSADGFASE